MMTGVAFTVGALTNVYFFQSGGKIAIDAAGGNVDAIIPLFINQAMPDLFVIIFMLTLLAAAMSTLSGLYHAMGTALICDIWGRGKACALSVKANQVGVIVMMVASLALALVMPGSIIAGQPRCSWASVRLRSCPRSRSASIRNVLRPGPRS
jgi:SSS family solute:Na+ symporter